MFPVPLLMRMAVGDPGLAWILRIWLLETVLKMIVMA
jgi:hypothetical protein